MRPVVFATAVAIASLITATGAAQSQNGQDDAVTQVQVVRKRIADFRQMLQSADSDTQGAAVEVALKDSSVAVRDAAISAALVRFTELTPQVTAEKGSMVGTGKVPDFGINGIHWSKDGRSFSADLGGHGEIGTAGQIAGGGLQLRYSRVAIDQSLFTASGTNTAQSSPVVCSAFLKVEPDKSDLRGPATCQGLPVMLDMSIAIGG